MDPNQGMGQPQGSAGGGGGGMPGAMAGPMSFSPTPLQQMIQSTQQRQQILQQPPPPGAQAVPPPVVNVAPVAPPQVQAPPQVDPSLQRVPIRAYLDQTVVPILLDGTYQRGNIIELFIFPRLAGILDVFLERTWSHLCFFLCRHVRARQGTTGKSGRIPGFLFTAARSQKEDGYAYRRTLILRRGK